MLLHVGLTSTPEAELNDVQIEHLINEDEAAKRLGIAPKTLARWRSVKRGPSYRKIGGAVRYTEADLANFIAVSAVDAQEGPR